MPVCAKLSYLKMASMFVIPFALYTLPYFKELEYFFQLFGLIFSFLSNFSILVVLHGIGISENFGIGIGTSGIGISEISGIPWDFIKIKIFLYHQANIK
jgi:hypothetical protein